MIPEKKFSLWMMAAICLLLLAATIPVVSAIVSLPTTTSLSSSPNRSVYGEPVTFTATVSADPQNTSPTGALSFVFFLGPVLTVPLAGGVATVTTNTLSAGSHAVTAMYSGDTSFGASTSPVYIQVVNRAATTMTVTSAPDPSGFGQTVTFTATVSPVAPGSGTPTGTVTFVCSHGPTLTGTLAGGTATVTTDQLPAGFHAVTTTYSGDTSFATCSGTDTYTVNQAATTTTVTSSPDPSVFGQMVAFTATVSPIAPGSGTPTGTVTFVCSDGPTLTGSLAGGTATVSTDQLPTGTHAVTAVYNGDINFSPSTSSGHTHTVNQAATTTTVTSSRNPSDFGQTVTFTATVSPVAPGSGTPTGTVTFVCSDGPTLTGSLAGGTATVTTDQLPAGSHSVTATYNGDGNFNGSASPVVTQIVNQAGTSMTLTGSPNPSAIYQMVTFTATVVPAGSGAPTGTVTFTITGGSTMTAWLAGGVATVTTSTLTLGDHSVTAVYSGDSNFTGCSGGMTETVNKAPTTMSLTAVPNPSVSGEPVTFTAAISSVVNLVPSGTVTFADGTGSMGTVPLAGTTAMLTTGSLSPGTHTVTATYSGDAIFESGTSPLLYHQVIVRPAITSYWPHQARKPKTVTLMVYGSDFLPGATVNLTKPSRTITSSPLSFAENAIVCTISLKGVPTGTYDLVVTSPDGGTATRAAAFRILPRLRR